MVACAAFGVENVPVYTSYSHETCTTEAKTMCCATNGAQLVLSTPVSCHSTTHSTIRKNESFSQDRPARKIVLVILKDRSAAAPAGFFSMPFYPYPPRPARPRVLFTHDTNDSLNDIPGRGAGSTAARPDFDTSGKHPNHPKTARFSECTIVCDGDSTERRVAGNGGTDRGAVGTQEAGSVVSDDCGRKGAAAGAGARAGAAKFQDGLVNRKLTWRYCA